MQGLGTAPGVMGLHPPGGDGNGWVQKKVFLFIGIQKMVFLFIGTLIYLL
jgi:hypothetical protein